MGAHRAPSGCARSTPRRSAPSWSSTRAAGWFEVEGRRLYTLCVGEKGVFRFHLRTRGRAGHASVPALGDNALLKLAPLLDALAAARAGADAGGPRFLSALLGERGGRRDASAARSSGSREPTRGRRLLRRADAGGDADARPGPAPRDKDNVIPSAPRPSSTAGCRRGWARREVRERIEAARPGGAATRSSSSSEVVGNRSPLRPPLPTRSPNGSRADPGAGAGADRDARFQRQPLVPQGVRARPSTASALSGG